MIRKTIKRWSLAMLALLVVAVSAYAVYHEWDERARHRREVAYQATLRSYTDSLKPGMTRKDVEAVLRGQGTFHRGGLNLNPWDDAMKIGEESAPWFCSENYVYVVFEFVAARHGGYSQANDADTLKTVRLYQELGGCL